MGRRVNTESSRKRRRPLLKSARLWVPVGIGVVVIGLGLVALNVVPKALTAKSELEAAIPLASAVQKQMLAGDEEAAAATVAKLSGHTEKARAATSGKVWRALEWIPVAGPNLNAVRVASETVDDLARYALVPASSISVDALKPVDGAVNIDAVRSLGVTVAEVQIAVNDAQTSLATLDRAPLIGQLDAGLTKLDDALAKADDLMESARPALDLLPGMLGGDGPRNYLAVMQGTAEARASGGGAGVFVLLTADNGSLGITAQSATAEFDNDLPETIIPLDEESLNIYSPTLGTYITNLTGTPDWPTSAALAQGWWAQQHDDRIDGVLGFDPVALGYLLGATGDVSLPNGQVLTAENAAPLFLSEAYAMFPDPKDQDLFFTAAAEAIFDGVKSNISDPRALISALVQASDEGRLKMWSANPDEQAVLLTTSLSGTLPVDNVEATAVGAFFNDTTGSKMDYYVDAAVAVSSDQCTTSSPTFVQTITLANSISKETADELPRYVTGPYYEPGFIATDILVYGPVGAAFESVTVDGAAAVPVTQGTHLGRPVMRINHVLAPQSSVVVVATLTGAAGEYGPLEIRTTPLPRATPLTVETPGCK